MPSRLLRDSRESGGHLAARGCAVEEISGGRREVPQRPPEDDCALSGNILMQYSNAFDCSRGRVSLTTGPVGDQEAGGQRTDDHRSQAAADDLPW